MGETTEPPKYGRALSYCTGGVFVMSEVLTDRYAKEQLFLPLGIAQAEWVFSPLDVPQTGGGLRLTSRDLMKIAQLYLNGGVWMKHG